MNGTAPGTSDPRLLLEAARVFNAAGPDYRKVAEVVAELALQARDKAEPEIRRMIIGDGVALRLSGRVPGGYREALELLKAIGDKKDDDPDGRLHLLRALARGQMYRDEREAGKSEDAPALAELRADIRKDLEFAFAQDNTLRVENRLFWQAAPASLAEGCDRQDDLRAVWLVDPEFRKLVELPADQATDPPPRPEQAPQPDNKSG
jgi:hypothetical protein